MRSCRVLAVRLSIDSVATPVDYADVFVVVREGQDGPGPSDWEANVRTSDHQHLAPGTYQLEVDTADGHVLAGRALLRFSDGSQHLFRGDGDLTGAAQVLAS